MSSPLIRSNCDFCFIFESHKTTSSLNMLTIARIANEGDEELSMKYIDWQMCAFVGLTLLQEYWCYFRLPRIYYWYALEDDDHRNAA
jgi:hypothetical protein